jgi:hypothetical protein
MSMVSLTHGTSQLLTCEHLPQFVGWAQLTTTVPQKALMKAQTQ